MHFLTLVLGVRKGRLAGIICLAVTIGILIACLWPFNFHPRNKVEWFQDENGIRFFGRGIVFSSGPLKIPNASLKNDAMTIELLLRPGKRSGYEWGSVLTLYNHEQEQFIFGQWKTNFNVRIPAGISRGEKLYRHLGIANALPREKTQLITVTSGKDETDIYVNGTLGESAPHYTLIRHDQGLSGYLVIGNSPEGTSPWNGDVLGMAIYDGLLNSREILDNYHTWQDRKQPIASNEHSSLNIDKLTSREAMKPIALYLFDEHSGQLIQDHSGVGNQLEVPDTFSPLRRIILIPPWKEHWFRYGYAAYIIMNVLGFVPFGFFLSAWLRYAKDLPAGRVYVIAILSGFCLSFAIELIQAYIPTRGSQIMDVITNTSGTALGSLLLFKHVVPALDKDPGLDSHNQLGR